MSSIAQPTTRQTPNWALVPFSVAYRSSRENVTRLLTESPQAADTRVPACPDWTVRDVVAHVLGICHTVARRTAGLAAAQPLPGPEAGVSELLDAWTRAGERAESQIDGLQRRRAGILTMDVFTHEIDICRALEAPVPEDHPSYPLSLRLVVSGFTAAAHAHGLAGLRIETPGAEWTVGEDEPTVTVHGHRHDLYRSLVGRRTNAQIGRLDWSVSPGPWLPAFVWGPFHPPAEAVEGMVGEAAANGL